jgi:hypothetical protein
MGRDSGGNYTLPNASFVNGTVISSSVMNSNFSDLSSEISSSLDRSGRGGMLARWRGVDGTSALPAYSFTAETTVGMYRAGTGDVRVSNNGTDWQKWSNTEVRVYQAFVAEKGATLTQSTSNTAALTATGNGTAAGVVATGGSTGNGVTGTGGATSGYGVRGVGTGNTAGVRGEGQGTGAGGSFVGGATGDGLTGTGGGSGKTGGVFTGGAGGTGAIGIAGTAATTTTRQNALVAQQGDIVFASVTNPNSDVAVTNTLTPKLLAKAMARITTDGAGGATVVSSATSNIASVAINGNDLRIVFAAPFADANFGVVASSSLSAVTPTNYNTSAGVSRVDITRIGGGSMDNPGETTIVAFGAQ